MFNTNEWYDFTAIIHQHEAEYYINGKLYAKAKLEANEIPA